MKKTLLETYVKRCIIAEQRQNSNIIKDIVDKFPSNYALPLAISAALALAIPLATVRNKLDVFLNRYSTDKAFKKQMNNSYAYKNRGFFDFWLLFDELKEYLKSELQNAELLLIENDKVSALKISDVSDVLKIAENVEEFEEMVKTLR